MNERDIARLLERLSELLNEVSSRVSNTLNRLDSALREGLERFSSADISEIHDAVNRFQSTARSIEGTYRRRLESLSSLLRSLMTSLERGDVSVEDVVSQLQSHFRDIDENVARRIRSSLESIAYDIESSIRSLSGQGFGVDISDIVERINRGDITVGDDVRRKIMNLSRMYDSISSLSNLISDIEDDSAIAELRRTTSLLSRAQRQGLLGQYLERVASKLLQSDVEYFGEFSISGLENALDALSLSDITRTLNDFLNRGFSSIGDVVDRVRSNIENLINAETGIGQLATTLFAVDDVYMSQLGLDVDPNLNELLQDRFIRREISDRLRSSISSLANLARQEIQAYSQTFGRLGEILTPILDLQPFDVALGGEMGLDFANGIRRVNTLFGNISVMLSQNLAQIVGEMERAMNQAYTREPLLYTEKFIEEAQQNMNRLSQVIPERLMRIADTMGIDISGFDLTTFEGIQQAYQRIRQEAVQRIRAGGDFREFAPIVELGTMITSYSQLREQLPQAIDFMRYMNFPELMSGFERFRFGFLQPLQEGLSQLGNFTIGSLSWIAMFGLSNAFFLASTMLPMEQSYRAYFPMYQALGGLFGFTQLFDRLQDFTYWLPWNMENLAMQYTTLSGLMGTPQMAQRMLQTALEVSRVEPIQFDEAMSVITAFSITPQIRYAMQRPDFQRAIFNTVQMLSLLVPEQGIEGAIFAVREFLNNQFLSIQRRFNIEIEAIASYAGTSVDELRSADPVRKIQLLSRALENIFGGNEELLLMRGATLMTQVNNVIDTLNNSLIRPLITLRSPEIERFLTDITQSGMLQRIAPDFYERAVDISRRTGMPIEQIVSDVYGTPYGLLALTMTGINTFLGRVFESLNVGQTFARMFMDISRDLMGIIGDYLSIDSPSPAITRHYGQLLLNAISTRVRDILSDTQLGDTISLISSFVGDVMASTFRNLTVGILKASVSALTEIPNVVAQTSNELIYGTVFSLGNTVRTSVEPLAGLISSVFNQIELLGRQAGGRNIDQSVNIMEELSSSFGRFFSSVGNLAQSLIQTGAGAGQAIATLATFTMPVWALRTQGLGGATLEFMRFSHLALAFEDLSTFNLIDAIQNLAGFQMFTNLQNVRFGSFRDLYRDWVSYATALMSNVMREIRLPLGTMLGMEAIQTGDISYAVASSLLLAPQAFRELARSAIQTVFSRAGLFRLGGIGMISAGLEYLEGYYGAGEVIDPIQMLLGGIALDQLFGQAFMNVSRRIADVLGFGTTFAQRLGYAMRGALIGAPLLMSQLDTYGESWLDNVLSGAITGAGIGSLFGGFGAIIGGLVGTGVGIWSHIREQSQIQNMIDRYVSEYGRNVAQMYSQMFTNILAQVQFYVPEFGDLDSASARFRSVSALSVIGRDLMNAVREYARGRYESVIRYIDESLADASIGDIQISDGAKIDIGNLRDALINAIENSFERVGTPPDFSRAMSQFIVSYFGDLPRLFSSAVSDAFNLATQYIPAKAIDADRFSQFVEDVIKGNVNLDDIMKAIREGGKQAIDALRDMGIEPTAVDIPQVMQFLNQFQPQFQKYAQEFADISSLGLQAIGAGMPALAWGFYLGASDIKLPEPPADITQVPQFFAEWSKAMFQTFRYAPFSAMSLARSLAMVEAIQYDEAGQPIMTPRGTYAIDFDKFRQTFISRAEEIWEAVSRAPSAVLARQPALVNLFTRAYLMGADLPDFPEKLKEAYDYQLQRIKDVITYPERVGEMMKERAPEETPPPPERKEEPQEQEKQEPPEVVIKTPKVNVVIDYEDID